MGNASEPVGYIVERSPIVRWGALFFVCHAFFPHPQANPDPKPFRSLCAHKQRSVVLGTPLLSFVKALPAQVALLMTLVHSADKTCR